MIITGLATASWTEAVSGQCGISQDALTGTEVFGGHVPVPMVVPGEIYSTRPWFYNEA